MKNIKINWMHTIAALSFILGISFFVQGQNPSKVKGETTKLVNTYHYVGDDTSEGAFANPDNWEEGPSPSSIPCGTGQNKPCETTATDKDELAEMFEGRSNLDIVNDPSVSTRQ